MAKNNEYYKQMNRSEKDIEKRIKAQIGKTSSTDVEVLEDKIIQLEEREKELMNEVNRLERLLSENGVSPQSNRIQPNPQWGSYTVDFSMPSGTAPQPDIRIRR